MRVLVSSLRLLGILLGLFLLLSGALGLAGFESSDPEYPSTLSHRLVTGTLSVLAGLCFLLPYRKLGPKVVLIVLTGMSLVSFRAGYLTVDTLARSAHGTIDPIAFPFGLTVLLIAVAHLWLLALRKREFRRMPSNTSFKVTPDGAPQLDR